MQSTSGNDALAAVSEQTAREQDEEKIGFNDTLAVASLATTALWSLGQPYAAIPAGPTVHHR